MAPFQKPSWWPSFGNSGKQQTDEQEDTSEQARLAAADETQPQQQLMLAQKVVKLANDSAARALASDRGLNIVTVSWEDCARTKGSCWGPCISDMTLRCSGLAMPVIRAPNYSDLTWDVPMDNIMLVVGNETPAAAPENPADTGAPPRPSPANEAASKPEQPPSLGDTTTSSVSLTQFLQDIERYTGITIRPAQLEVPATADGAERAAAPPSSTTGLLAPERDSHALVSAQACFLPVATSGEAEFQVALYNYQSRASDPAVMVLVVSSQGTSAQVADGTHAGQHLWFNDHGIKKPFAAVRLKDDRAARGVAVEGEMSEKEKQDNVLLVIQVPLKQRQQALPRECAPWSSSLSGLELELLCEQTLARRPSSSQSRSRRKEEVSDVDHAIVKLGRAAGTFPTLAGQAFERDVRYPVRVTLQFYKCTSNGVVDEHVMKEIAQQMADAKDQGEFWGSLVTSTTNRPTEHTGPAVYTNPAAQ